MILRDWDVWLNYSWYFVQEIDDIQSLAFSLVESDICKVVFDSRGHISWKNEKSVHRDKVDINRIGHESRAIISFPEGLAGYQLEGAYQSAKMRWYEMYLLNIAKFEYIRGFLGACYLTHPNRTIVCYPQIKVYYNGVVVLSYRIISPKAPYRLKDLIENEVNLYKHNFPSISAPPGLIKQDTRSEVVESTRGIIDRLRALGFIQYADKQVDKMTEVCSEKDFKFEICPLDVLRDESVPINLDLLRDITESSITHTVNDRRTALEHILRGVNRKIQVGKFRYGMPTIYILEFANQPNSSKAAVKRFRHDINRIMLRTSYGKLKNSTLFPWEDLRPFDDYSFFMNKAVALFIFGKDGLKNDEEYADPNRGHLIYSKQIIVEALMYTYMSHLRQLERASILNIPTKRIMREQQEILELEEEIEKNSSYGEIQDIFDLGCKIFDLRNLREKAEKILTLRAQTLREHTDTLLKRFGLLVSILFGFSGALSFSLHILKPIWQYFNLWMPINQHLRELYLSSLSVAFFFVIVALLWQLAFSRAGHS